MPLLGELANLRLTRLCNLFGVTRGGRDALGDAMASVRVYWEQVVGKIGG